MKRNIFKKSVLVKVNGGFTLIEMIVSMAIFTVVALIATGALLKVLDANKKSINLKNAVNNLNFVLESMSREFRVGTKYYCALAGEVSSVSKDYDNTTLHPNYKRPAPRNGYAEADNLYELGSARLETGGCNGDNVSSWLIAFRSKNKITGAGGITCDSIHAYRLYNQQLQKAEQKSCNSDIENVDFKDLVSPEISLFRAYASIIYPGKALFVLEGTTGTKIKDQIEFRMQTNVTQRVKDPVI